MNSCLSYVELPAQTLPARSINAQQILFVVQTAPVFKTTTCARTHKAVLCPPLSTAQLTRHANRLCSHSITQLLSAFLKSSVLRLDARTVHVDQKQMTVPQSGNVLSHVRMMEGVLRTRKNVSSVQKEVLYDVWMETVCQEGLSAFRSRRMCAPRINLSRVLTRVVKGLLMSVLLEGYLWDESWLMLVVQLGCLLGALMGLVLLVWTIVKWSKDATTN